MQHAPALRRAVTLAVVLLVAIGLGVLALSQSDLGEEHVADLWARTRLLPLLLALLIMSLGLCFMGLRWRSLVPGGEGLPLIGMTGAVASGLLLNYALPGPVGELAAPMLIQRRYGFPAETTLAAGIHARFVGLATAGLFAGFAWALGDLPVPDQYRALVRIAAVAIVAGALALGILSSRPVLLRALSEHSVGRLAGEGMLRGFFGKLNAAILRVADSLGMVGRIGFRRYGMAVLWSVCGHVAVATGIWFGAGGMGMDPSPFGVVFTYCAATAAVVALFALPGGQLGWDALFCAFFTVTTGVELPDAIAVTVLVRVQQIILLLLGALSLALLSTD